MVEFEGYWKVICIMKMVEDFDLFVLIFVDMLGVYFGIGVEERG